MKTGEFSGRKLGIPLLVAATVLAGCGVDSSSHNVAPIRAVNCENERFARNGPTAKLQAKIGMLIAETNVLHDRLVTSGALKETPVSPENNGYSFNIPVKHIGSNTAAQYEIWSAKKPKGHGICNIFFGIEAMSYKERSIEVAKGKFIKGQMPQDMAYSYTAATALYAGGKSTVSISNSTLSPRTLYQSSGTAFTSYKDLLTDEGVNTFFEQATRALHDAEARKPIGATQIDISGPQG